ncbi:hypothetical protein [Nocardioides sp.]|uniref:hypothetical protein n=1 Tax=Nocardioides sp. TaxID=35761 RepID=UPI001993942B|nr:hypothetical protein [Nocardioides sp.]MBC7278752.1 hypothetical protein [Nocardioides sp.]
MKNLISRVFTGLGAGALAIAAVMAMPTPAQAADTYTPNGGPISVVGEEIIFTDVYADQSSPVSSSTWPAASPTPV